MSHRTPSTKCESTFTKRFHILKANILLRYFNPRQAYKKSFFDSSWSYKIEHSRRIKARDIFVGYSAKRADSIEMKFSKNNCQCRYCNRLHAGKWTENQADNDQSIMTGSANSFTIGNNTHGSLWVKEMESVCSGWEKSKGRRTSPSSRRLEGIQ